jgi:hypothetical protein
LPVYACTSSLPVTSRVSHSKAEQQTKQLHPLRAILVTYSDPYPSFARLPPPLRSPICLFSPFRACLACSATEVVKIHKAQTPVTLVQCGAAFRPMSEVVVDRDHPGPTREDHGPTLSPCTLSLDPPLQLSTVPVGSFCRSFSCRSCNYAADTLRGRQSRKPCCCSGFTDNGCLFDPSPWRRGPGLIHGSARNPRPCRCQQGAFLDLMEFVPGPIADRSGDRPDSAIELSTLCYIESEIQSSIWGVLLTMIQIL